MYIGVTLLFLDSNSNEKVNGVLKSIVLNTDLDSLNDNANTAGVEIGNHYKYDYLGINDVFMVSGKIEPGAVLGRMTYYELDSLKKAEKFLPEFYSCNPSESLRYYNANVFYFCQNEQGQNFSISILTVVKGSNEELESKIEEIAQNQKFLKLIKDNSLEKLANMDFVGIEDIGEVDLKFQTVQTFYAQFDDLDELNSERISDKEIEIIIKDIVN